MEWTRNCYVSFVVWLWRNLAKRAEEALSAFGCLFQLSLVTIPPHCHRFLSFYHFITTLVRPQVELQCYTSVGWVVARPVTVYAYCTDTIEGGEVLYNKNTSTSGSPWRIQINGVRGLGELHVTVSTMMTESVDNKKKTINRCAG